MSEAVQLVEARVPEVGEVVPVLIDGSEYRLHVKDVTSDGPIVHVWLNQQTSGALVIATLVCPAA